MNPNTSAAALEVAVQTRVELDAALDRAVEALKPLARMKRAGIAVTRVQPHRYRVAVCESTPYGTTTQHWAPN
jgi:hypothetical protein